MNIKKDVEIIEANKQGKERLASQFAECVYLHRMVVLLVLFICFAVISPVDTSLCSVDTHMHCHTDEQVHCIMYI